MVNANVINGSCGNVAGCYFAMTLAAFPGTLASGLFSKKPVLVGPNLLITTMAVALIGANDSLTYGNVLVAMLIGVIVSFILGATPLRKIFVDGIPKGVRKALPAAIGLYVCIQALENTGLMNAGTLASAGVLEDLNVLYFWLLLAGILIFVVYRAAGRVNAYGSTYVILIALMWVIGISFFMEDFVGGQTATTLVYQRVNLIVATDGASPYTIAGGISSLNLGLLSSGFDFSAFSDAGGNTALFLIENGFLFGATILYWNTGVLDTVTDDEKAQTKAICTTSLAGLIAVVLGVPALTVSECSTLAKKDGAENGQSAAAASVGYLVALFSWVFFALSATTTNGVGMWISETETKLAAYVQDGFAFNALLLVLLGGSMVFAAFESLLKETDIKAEKSEENGKEEKKESIPSSLRVSFTLTFLGIALSGNLVAGMALGIAAAFLLLAFEEKKRALTKNLILITAIFAVFGFLTFRYGTNFITVVQQMMMGGPPA